MRKAILAIGGLFASLTVAVPDAALAADVETIPWTSSVESTPSPFAIEGLPDEAPRSGIVITVDTTRNVLYLFEDGELIRKDLAATGMDTLMRKGNRSWLFRTPRGRLPILRKIVDPVWTRPDWAFIEEGKKVPPAGSPQRRVPGALGKYALDLGDGILIHGTKDVSSLGKKASHGCVRLGAEMLDLVFREAEVGTPVYIF